MSAAHWRSGSAPRARLLAGLVCFFLSASAVTRGSAQAGAAGNDSSRNASARALFEEGIALGEQGDWAGAEDRFRRARALRASPVITYNLASALVERGKLVEASEILRSIDGDAKAEPELQKSARHLREELSRRIGRLTLSVIGFSKGDRVQLDETYLFDAQLGVEIPIDPGSHQLRLWRAGRVLDSRHLLVAERGNEKVSLNAPVVFAEPRALASAALRSSENTAESGPDSAPSAATAATRDTPAITSRWWFWTGLGVVAVGAVAVGVALAAGGSAKPESAYHGNFSPAALNVEVSK
jgi:hypothetical protein